MSDSRVLLGLCRFTIPLPNRLWRYLVTQDQQKLRRSLGFMTNDHHAIRDFVVRELPEYGSPLEASVIAEQTGLDVDRVISILEELERHLTFLVRDQSGAVLWAYPVTVDKTPHRIRFETGQRINAA